MKRNRNYKTQRFTLGDSLQRAKELEELFEHCHFFLKQEGLKLKSKGSHSIEGLKKKRGMRDVKFGRKKK